MSSYRHILWLDLETTGSDERLHEIIEIGCVLTDRSLREISHFRRCVTPKDNEWSARVDDVVDEMHQANGLWEDLAANGIPCGIAQTDTLAWLLREVVSQRRIAIGGSGVSHFDMRFLRKYMPLLCDRVTYWALDVGAVRRMFKRAGIPGPLFDGKNHRALDDARLHLDEWRYYENYIRYLSAAAPENASPSTEAER